MSFPCFIRSMSLLFFAWVGAGCGGSPQGRLDPLKRANEPADLLVFAPHPDDEVLGCAGIVRQALSAGKRVKIVLFTNGDGFPSWASLLAHKPVEQLTPEDYVELARFRQIQCQAALKTLGAKPEDLVFLGYPDAGLDQVYLARGSTPFRQKYTQKAETHGPAQKDYHSAVHGSPAPCTYASALSDVVELIRVFRPERICVTAEADRHRDHQASFRFVRDGVTAAGYEGAFETYVIHGGEEWPWPKGATPESPFQSHDVKNERIPLGMPWPPPHRIPLSTEDQRLKQAAIRAHATHLEAAVQGPDAEERKYFDSFIKSEEIFWPLNPR